LGRSRESVEHLAVVGGLAGFGLGSAIYLFGLLTRLY
jgi:hypothetical protein